MSVDWSFVRLKDYCTKIGSGSTPRGGANVYLDSGNVCLIRSQNIYNDGFSENGLVFISDSDAEKLNNVEIELNDVLINITGDSVARVCLAPKDKLPARVNQHVAIIRTVKNELDPKFVRYFLTDRNTQNHLLTLAGTGATRNALTKGMLEEFLVPKPDILIQKKISKILSDLDEKIHLNNQINQTLESIAQTIFKSWYIDFDPVRAKIAAKLEGADPEIAAMCVISGKSEAELKKMPEDDFAELQATAVLFPDELVESELGEVPRGWEVTRFNKIILQYIDNRGKTPPTQIDGIPLLEVKHLPEGSLNPDLNTEKRVSLETFNNWFRAHLQEDDLIISTVGTIGRLCIIPADKKLTIAQNILGLRFEKDEVNPLFMYYQMDSCKFRNDVNARLVITVQASIKRKDLETIDLLKPDINIQNVFAEKIKPFVLSQQSDESLKLIDIRDTLLPKLLSGEVSVEDIKQQQD